MTPRFDVIPRLLISLAHRFGLAGSASAAPLELTAWDAVKQMGIGADIGNTLENTTHWEAGGDISRKAPHNPSPALREALSKVRE